MDTLRLEQSRPWMFRTILVQNVPSHVILVLEPGGGECLCTHLRDTQLHFAATPGLYTLIRTTGSTPFTGTRPEQRLDQLSFKRGRPSHGRQAHWMDPVRRESHGTAG
jgi:hypothetical protein